MTAARAATMDASSARSLPGSSTVILEKGRARFTLVVGTTTPGTWRGRFASAMPFSLAISLTSGYRMSQGSGVALRLSVRPGKDAGRACRRRGPDTQQRTSLPPPDVTVGSGKRAGSEPNVPGQRGLGPYLTVPGRSQPG